MDQDSETKRREELKRVPDELVREAALEIGLDKPIPAVIYVSDFPGGKVWETPVEPGAVIVISEKLRGAPLQSTLRHELAHYKLHHPGTPAGWRSVKATVIRELEATKLAEGKITPTDLSEMAGWAVDSRGMLPGRAWFTVSSIAKVMQVPRGTIAWGRKIFKRDY